MKNKEYLKKYLFQSFIIITFFSISLILIEKLEYQKYKQNFNYKINAIIETIQEEYHNTGKEKIVELLNKEDFNENILKEYGYDIDKDSYIMQNDKTNFKFNIIKIAILLSAFLILTYLFIRYNLNNDREINKIIKMIEDINHKNYKLKLDELSEDKLSILKQEIYKTTIMLKEQAENSLKDKINLKNSIQDISHQLKTPLTSIHILIDNTIDNPDMDPITRDKFIKEIKRATTNITFLVQSILTLSKFESNTITFIKENNSINKIINAAIQNVSNLCDLKNIKIEIENRIESKIYCDFKWQVEALTNILKNAVEYSSRGSKVSIECEKNNLYLQLKIKDSGKGMDQEDVSNIFKRFYKGKDSSKDSVGIGLSLSKAIIEEDNGIISVESQKEKGTAFIIKYFFDIK